MYRWLDFRTWDANHVQMAAAGMKAHAKIRFNIYVNIGAIGVAEYFLWVLWKMNRIGNLGSPRFAQIREDLRAVAAVPPYLRKSYAFSVGFKMNSRGYAAAL